jgi:hypothetical protein
MIKFGKIIPGGGVATNIYSRGVSSGTMREDTIILHSAKLTT